MKITDIDKNFLVNTDIKRDGMVFYNALETPFEINGIFYDDGKYRRLPEAVAKTVNDGVYGLHANTAGGRVRFKTTSPYVAIHSVFPSVHRMSHFAMTGSSGFDLYVDGCFVKSFVPPLDMVSGYDSIIELGNGDMKEIMIGFPLYNDVNELYVGLDGAAHVTSPTPYAIDVPIVFYGSSITQGGCASRPGSSYEAIVSRALNADYINLGFSGSARAEDEIADYIAGLEMSAFVYDYDHNAPDMEHFERTHERMFLKIREKHPTLPIIMMPRPNVKLNDVAVRRREIILETYDRAIKRGDTNVYYIDGSELMALAGDEGTVDFTHPTDLGFFSMATALTAKLRSIFK